MPSVAQKREWLAANDTQGWADLFEWAGPHAKRHRCTACGVCGYIHSQQPEARSWTVTHLMGHAACPTCGRLIALAGLAGHAFRAHQRP